MHIGDSARWNRGSMATLSAPPAHAWLATQPRSGPPARDDTQRSSRTVPRPDPATPAERPSNSSTAAAAAVALRPIPAPAIQTGGTVAASIAAHRAGLARKAAAGAEQAPRPTHSGREPTPQTAAAQRTDADALARGRLGPRGDRTTGRRCRSPRSCLTPLLAVGMHAAICPAQRRRDPASRPSPSGMYTLARKSLTKPPGSSSEAM